MSKFKHAVININGMVPLGKVVSYGQVALMAGAPRAAQAVGQVLRNLELDMHNSKYSIPWWRVVNNVGRVSIKGSKYHNAITQKDKLESEGIIIDKDLTFDIEKYRWRPPMNIIKKLGLDEDYVEMIIGKYLI